MSNITINLNIGGKTKTRSIADPPPPIPDIILKRGFADAHPFRDRKLKPKKKKQCTKGHQCGFSCVSPTKICLADMTTAQLKAHNAAKRAERREKAKAKKAATGGGGIMPSSEVKTYQEAIERGKALSKDLLNAVPRLVEAKEKYDSAWALMQQEREKEWAKMDLSGDYNTEVKKYEERLKPAQARLDEAIQEYNAVKESVLGEFVAFRGSLMSSSQLTEIDAQKIADGIDIDKSVMKKRRRVGVTYSHNENDLREGIKEFMLITDGKGRESFKRMEMSKDGAFARRSENLINIGTPKEQTKEQIKETLFHEIGHHAEYESAKMNEIAMSWVKSRATSDDPVPLSKLTGVKSYDRRNGIVEVAYPDKFVDPYVGKEYYRASSEVISVGLEHFSSPEKMFKLAEKDPDHFYLTIGLLRG